MWKYLIQVKIWPKSATEIPLPYALPILNSNYLVKPSRSPILIILSIPFLQFVPVPATLTQIKWYC